MNGATRPKILGNVRQLGLLTALCLLLAFLELLEDLHSACYVLVTH